MLRGSYAARPACSQPPDQTFPWILHLGPFHSQQDVDSRLRGVLSLGNRRDSGDQVCPQLAQSATAMSSSWSMCRTTSVPAARWLCRAAMKLCRSSTGLQKISAAWSLHRIGIRPGTCRLPRRIPAVRPTTRLQRLTDRKCCGQTIACRARAALLFTTHCEFPMLGWCCARDSTGSSIRTRRSTRTIARHRPALRMFPG